MKILAYCNARSSALPGIFTMILLMSMLLLMSTASAQVNPAGYEVNFMDVSYADPTTDHAGTPTTEYDPVQLPAETSKPVNWVKEVKVHNVYDQAHSKMMVNIPEDASNIQVRCVQTGKTLDYQHELDTLTFNDVLGFNEERSYIIKYTTTPPQLKETTVVFSEEGMKKNVIVSSAEHYLDVLTYAEIPPLDPVKSDKLRLYWYIDGEKTDVTTDSRFDVRFYDSDNDGFYDRMSWVTPHLSTQIFEIVIISDGDAGSYPSIDIDLLSPADASYIYSTSQVTFNYTVHHNSSTSVLCNISVDGSVWEENIPAVGYTSIQRYFNLSSGTHNWFVNCAGDDGSANTSTTRTFTIDLDAPAVTLSTKDYIISNTDSIDLNFTPTDSEDQTLVCAIDVNGAPSATGINVSSGSKYTYSMTGMSNGVYDWNVSCRDGVGNVGYSEERVFYISQGIPPQYSLEPNKDEYSLGQTGYLIINAEPGSNLTMFVSKPNGESFFNYYNDRTFPLIEMINYTDKVGTFSIDGIFTKGTEVFIVSKSFKVSNTFSVHIDMNETSGQPSDVFTFEAASSGGLGDVKYEWDFDDGSTTTGNNVDHTFPERGDYSVRVTATDSKGNAATDTIDIKIYNRYALTVYVRELQTQTMLEGASVEVDDERMKTDNEGKAVFSLYEGKKKIYVTQEGYQTVKKIKNITADTTLTIDINNTGITNYTLPVVQSETQADSNFTEAEAEANSDVEMLIAQIESAIADIDTVDEATKSIIQALSMEQELQNAKRTLRQLIRDIGNTQTKSDLTPEEKLVRIENLTKDLDSYQDLIAGIEVQDTTQFVDYPKTPDISMMAEEYLKHKAIKLSRKEKAKYVKELTELQTQATINTRLSQVTVTYLSGTTETISLVENTIQKKPNDTEGMFFMEYIPKEVTEHSDNINQITEYSIVKDDPMLRFDVDLESYSYFIKEEVSMDNLRKTKHVLFKGVSGETKGMTGVTGYSFLPDIHVDNPKLVIEIAIIILLLIAYIIYHFDLIDKAKTWYAKRDPQTAPYETDMAYNPVSKIDSIISKVKSYFDKEEKSIQEELVHIRKLISTVHRHANNNDHHEATEAYKKVGETYKELSPQAKQKIHTQTKEAYNKTVIARINHMLTEAGIYLENNQHSKAKNHYSEIKKLYNELEKEHRAAVSAKCIKLHEKLFDASLT